MNTSDTAKAAECLERLEAIKAEGNRKRAEKDRRVKREVAESMIALPELGSAVAIKNISKSEHVDISALVTVLQEEAGKVVKGDDSSIQRYLFGQLHLTDMLFHRLATSMLDSSNADITKFKALGDLASKFQNMSRRTAATLVDIKRPRQKTYIRRVDQLNAAHNQQVNSTEPEKQSKNEILEASHDERLEREKTQAAIGADTRLGTLEEYYGAENQEGESEVAYERIKNG